jgi:hypothetical protein
MTDPKGSDSSLAGVDERPAVLPDGDTQRPKRAAESDTPVPPKRHWPGLGLEIRHVTWKYDPATKMPTSVDSGSDPYRFRLKCAREGFAGLFKDTKMQIFRYESGSVGDTDVRLAGPRGHLLMCMLGDVYHFIEMASKTVTDHEALFDIYDLFKEVIDSAHGVFLAGPEADKESASLRLRRALRAMGASQVGTMDPCIRGHLQRLEAVIDTAVTERSALPPSRDSEAHDNPPDPVRRHVP